MPNVTISVDEHLYERMKKLEFVNWSAVARVTFRALTEELEKTGNPKKQVEKKLLELMLQIFK